jgi:hypothetical protein
MITVLRADANADDDHVARRRARTPTITRSATRRS